MKKHIKLISVVLIIMVIMAHFTTFNFAQEDITPPTILSISTDKSTLKVGEKIIFDMEVEDDISGAKSFAVFWQLKGDSSRQLNKQYDYMTDIGSYEYTIPANTAAGEWEATNVIINDNLNNTRIYSITGTDEEKEILANFNFTIEDTNQDITPPVISNINKITETVTAPGEFRVQYDVIDDNSGVNETGIGLTYNPKGDPGNMIQTATQKIGENTYESVFYIHSEYESFVFNGISVTDNAGNWKLYSKEELGIGNELDIIPDNYIEDTTAPKMLSYSYEKTELLIPDSVNITMKLEEKESGLGGFIGRAWFKSDDGKFDKQFSVSCGIDNNGQQVYGEGAIRIDFGYGDSYRGKVHMYMLELYDNAGNTKIYTLENGDFEKKEFNVSEIKKEYTLTTSMAKKDYIDEIADLPNGSTVLCNVVRNNQVIEKELFDAIKGKDITVTFMSIYNANGEVTSTMGEISSGDTNTGIQWIINGKDIVNETKDVDMNIRIVQKEYSKYIVPGYEINENLENDFWDEQYEKYGDEMDYISLEKEQVKLQKKEIKKYFDTLKKDGYDVDKAYKNAVEYLEEVIHTDCKSAIIYGNDYIEYISIEFEENGLLPCKTLIRMKPDYAMRALIGVKDLKVYYADNGQYSLIDNNVKVDEEKYYNFEITHNSEYWLTNGVVEKLDNKNYKLDETPKTGGFDYTTLLGSVVLLGTVVLIKRK